MPRKSNHLVKESNVLARAWLDPPVLSVWEWRVISAIAAKNRYDDAEFREQVIMPEDLTVEGEVSTDQFRKIKISVDKLASTKFKITMGRRGIMIYPIFAKIGVEDEGTIVGRFNQDLKEFYLELRKQFALWSLRDFQVLSSMYSQMLYRFLVSWHKTHPEIVVGIDELHSLLNTPPTVRKDFTQFRTRVLDVAHREIDEAAQNSTEEKPLEFDWEPVKEGARTRKVIAVRFIFNIRGRQIAAEIDKVLSVIHDTAPQENAKITKIGLMSLDKFEIAENKVSQSTM